MNIWEQYPEIEYKLNKVDEIISTSIKSRNKLLREINESLLKSGGKRLRPALTILSAGFGEYEESKLLRVAGAIEVLHTATLVHDDIIDRAKLRRGRITVSDKFGAEMAVYTGDFLFTKAILMLSDSMPADKMEIVARAIKNICEGEVDQYESKYKCDISILSYLKRINRKTAILFAASAGLGGYCSDCKDELTKQLIKVGGYYGMAFQIKDDINDYVNSEEHSGKPVLKDLQEGILTLPVIYAMNNDKSLSDTISNLFNKKGSITAFDAYEIGKLIMKSNGVEQSRELMEKYINKSLKILKRLPDSVTKPILENIIKGLLV